MVDHAFEAFVNELEAYVRAQGENGSDLLDKLRPRSVAEGSKAIWELMVTNRIVPLFVATDGIQHWEGASTEIPNWAIPHLRVIYHVPEFARSAVKLN